MPTRTTQSQTRKSRTQKSSWWPSVFLALALFLAPCVVVVLMQSSGQSSQEQAARDLRDLRDLTEENFSAIHSTIQPSGEKWKSIPWRTSLLDAQNAAVESQKPIFIWTMDGNPLGCT